MMSRGSLRTRRKKQGRFYRKSGELFDRVIARYGEMLTWVLDRQRATLLVAVLTLVLTIALYVVIPKGFFPVQDTGAIQGITEAPQSISFAAMAERQQAVARSCSTIPPSTACRRSSASTAPTRRSTAAAC
jgi:multidrug efflux pump subunit AcrB